MMLRLEIGKLKRVVERVMSRIAGFVCIFSVSPFRLFDRKFGEVWIFFADERPVGQSNALSDQLYRMSSKQLWTQLQKTLQTLGTALQIVRKEGEGEDATQCGETVLKKWQHPGREGVVVAGQDVLFTREIAQSYRK